VQVRVDETRHGIAAATVDLALAPVSVVRSDNAVFDDGDIGFDQRAGDDVEQTHILDHNIRRFGARAGADHSDERFFGWCCHRLPSLAEAASAKGAPKA
jgi:hypothetical protein